MAFPPVCASTDQEIRCENRELVPSPHQHFVKVAVHLNTRILSTPQSSATRIKIIPHFYNSKKVSKIVKRFETGQAMLKTNI